MISTLESLQKQQLIQIQDGAIVTWPVGASKPTTQQLSSLTGVGPLRAAFRGVLFRFAAGAATGTFARPLAHYAMDGDFIKRVRDQITEGTSTLFLLTSGAVLDRVAEALKGQQFEIISTNLSQEQEDQFREAVGTETTSSPKMTAEHVVAPGVQGPSVKKGTNT